MSDNITPKVNPMQTAPKNRTIGLVEKGSVIAPCFWISPCKISEGSWCVGYWGDSPWQQVQPSGWFEIPESVEYKNFEIPGKTRAEINRSFKDLGIGSLSNLLREHEEFSGHLRHTGYLSLAADYIDSLERTIEGLQQ